MIYLLCFFFIIFFFTRKTRDIELFREHWVTIFWRFPRSLYFLTSLVMFYVVQQTYVTTIFPNSYLFASKIRFIKWTSINDASRMKLFETHIGDEFSYDFLRKNNLEIWFLSRALQLPTSVIPFTCRFSQERIPKSCSIIKLLRDK